jgi:hypothetical protein
MPDNALKVHPFGFAPMLNFIFNLVAYEHRTCASSTVTEYVLLGAIQQRLLLRGRSRFESQKEGSLS